MLLLMRSLNISIRNWLRNKSEAFTRNIAWISNFSDILPIISFNLVRIRGITGLFLGTKELWLCYDTWINKRTCSTPSFCSVLFQNLWPLLRNGPRSLGPAARAAARAATGQSKQLPLAAKPAALSALSCKPRGATAQASRATLAREWETVPWPPSCRFFGCCYFPSL